MDFNMNKECNLVRHARKEFSILGWDKSDDSDESQSWMCDDVIELLKLFGSQGHSGTSAPYALELFTKLASFKVIAPLTGEDSEWGDTGDGLFQNNRASTVFKNGVDGTAYDINAIVFRDSKGYCWTSSESSLDVEFPYTPTTKYVDSTDHD